MNTTQKFFARLFNFSALLLLTLISNSHVRAQQNAVDPTFNAVPSKQAEVSAGVLPQPDGKIIVVGNFQVVNGAAKNQIVRLNPDGSLDATFNCDECNFAVLSVALQPDGKILVAGSRASSSGSGSTPHIIRLNPDGSRDSSFASPFPESGGQTGSSLSVGAIQPDGKILVVNSVSISNYGYFDIYRLNPDGTLDTGFTRIGFQGGQNIREFVNKVAVLPDGKILVSGGTGGVGSSAFLRRYNADGTRDTTFESPTFSNTTTSFNRTIISDFEVLADGSIVFVGNFTAVNGVSRRNFAKILPAGNVDANFAPPADYFVGDDARRIEITPTGQFIVSVGSSDLGNRFYRYNADGSLDATFASPGNLFRIISLKLDSAGRIVLFGAFGENGATVFRLARLNPNGSLDAYLNTSIEAGGSVSALAVQADGKVILGGDFSRLSGVPRANFGRVNADGSVDTTFNTGSGFDSTVEKIVVQPDGKILVGGLFGNYNGDARAGVARLNSDGTLDAGFNPLLPASSVFTIALQADGKILIGGFFTSVNGQTRTNIARLNSDGTLDAGFNPTFGGGQIRSIVVQADGKIMVGGSFNGVNGFNRTGVVRLNADGSLDTSFNAGTISSVRQVEILPDGRYVVLSNGVVRLNNNGTPDNTFASPVFNDVVNAILVQPDGSVIVVGNFTAVNNVPRLRLARLKPNGTLDLSFFPTGANRTVRTIVRQSDDRILIGGDFTLVAGVNRIGVARLTVSPTRNVTPYDFDGDGRADVAVFRPSNGSWYILQSSNNAFAAVQFGQGNDQIAPADYDGDGRTDIAVFRGTVPGAGNLAYFYITNSSNNSFVPVQFGATGDVPVSGDWDGDGRGDLAVYREGAAGAQSFFFYRPSSQPGVNFRTIQWGAGGDKPLVGDFDGDGRLDAAVFRPSTATWYILRSSNNTVIQTTFGLSTDIPTPADFDGDGTANIAVFRPSTGTWFTSTNPANNYGAIQFGANGDVPVPADYDGDGRADVAVFRPSNGAWYLNRSTQGFTGVAFGSTEDKPIPNAYIR